jgi:hypothetical protein
MSMSDVSDRERFDFEREKWRADVVLRERDTALKERDNAAARWRSPLVVAIFAAAVVRSNLRSRMGKRNRRASSR